MSSAFPFYFSFLKIDCCVALNEANKLLFSRAIQWFYLMRANKKEKYKCTLIGVLGKLYTIFNRTIFYVFWAIKNNFRLIKNGFL